MDKESDADPSAAEIGSEIAENGQEISNEMTEAADQAEASADEDGTAETEMPETVREAVSLIQEELDHVL